jgi:ectoine hydroxylase-related dioxygenase (phytanoyl-CoA dioxygenase family)
MISDQEVARYHEEGWLVVEGVLDHTMLAEVRRVVAALVERARGKTTHDDVYDLEPMHSPEAPRVRRIKRPHVVHPVFREVLLLPSMLSILQRLLGPHVRLHGSKLNMKAARHGSPVEWHQDWAFYPHTNDDLLAIGVLLDDVLLENAPLLVLPGTHRGPAFDHHQDGRFCGAMDPARFPDLDFKSAVPLLGRAGACSFHHVRLVHGSAQNTSDRPRNLLLYECAAADAWPLAHWTDLEEFDSRMLCGAPTLEPRLEPVPVRMPFPPALRQGSIYENQLVLANPYFEVDPA